MKHLRRLAFLLALSLPAVSVACAQAARDSDGATDVAAGGADGAGGEEGDGEAGAAQAGGKGGATGQAGEAGQAGQAPAGQGGAGQGGAGAAGAPSAGGAAGVAQGGEAGAGGMAAGGTAAGGTAAGGTSAAGGEGGASAAGGDSGAGGQGGSAEQGGAAGAAGSAGAPVCNNKVLINELMTHRMQADVLDELWEFVELINDPAGEACTIDLSKGFSLYRDGIELWSGSTSPLFKKGKRYVIAGKSLGQETPDVVDFGFTAPALPVDGACVELRRDGAVVDRVCYGTSGDAPAPDPGASIGRVPDAADSGDDAADFAKIAAPTPGDPNQ